MGALDDGTSKDGKNGRPRGFAGMDRERQRQIASKGGKMAHQKHTAHEFSSAEARAAGRLGGVSVSQNRQHMAEIGRQGGRARRVGRAPANGQSPQTFQGSVSPAQEEAGAPAPVPAERRP